MFQPINGFKGIEIDKELMCIFADKGITRLIHCHRDTRQANFAYCASRCNKDRIYGIEAAITMSQTFLSNSLFCGKRVGRAYIFRSKERHIAVPIRTFAGFRCATTENLNYFCKADLCFCPIIEVGKQSSYLLL